VYRPELRQREDERLKVRHQAEGLFYEIFARPIQNTTTRRETKCFQQLYEKIVSYLHNPDWQSSCGWYYSCLVWWSGVPIVLFYTAKHDWIGAACNFGQDLSSEHHLGGNGTVSVRSPKHLLHILQYYYNQKQHQRQERQLEGVPGVPSRGNDDIWYVKQLRQCHDRNETRNGIPPPKLPRVVRHAMHCVSSYDCDAVWGTWTKQSNHIQNRNDYFSPCMNSHRQNWNIQPIWGSTLIYSNGRIENNKPISIIVQNQIMYTTIQLQRPSKMNGRRILRKMTGVNCFIIFIFIVAYSTIRGRQSGHK